MESPARQHNGELFRTEPSIHCGPRVFQRPAIESPATPADQNGRRSQKGRRAQRTAGNPAVRFDPQQPRLTETGRRPQGVADVPLTKRNRRPRQGKREISAGAVREDETGANRMTGFRPRVRSASTDRKHGSNASQFLTAQLDRLPPPAAGWLPFRG